MRISNVPICDQFEAATFANIEKQLEAGKIQVRYHLLNFLDNSSVPAGYSSLAANFGNDQESLIRRKLCAAVAAEPYQDFNMVSALAQKLEALVVGIQQAGSTVMGVLGRFGGVAVHDAWARYDTYSDVEHQLCCAHALRDLVGVANTPAGLPWCWAYPGHRRACRPAEAGHRGHHRQQPLSRPTP